eukprot:12415784-Karenia_brevis.AAC.1
MATPLLYPRRLWLRAKNKPKMGPEAKSQGPPWASCLIFWGPSAGHSWGPLRKQLDAAGAQPSQI